MREMLSLFVTYTPICTDTIWENWYQFCIRQEPQYGVPFSHISCRAETLRPNGIRTRSKYLKKIEALICNKEPVSHLGFYILPADFHQAAFDFKVYMGLSLGELNYCEITIENHFIKDFSYLLYLDTLRTFLHIEKAEVNLLPHTQVFNYNVNCILNSSGVREKYDVIQKIYAE